MTASESLVPSLEHGLLHLVQAEFSVPASDPL